MEFDRLFPDDITQSSIEDSLNQSPSADIREEEVFRR